VEAHQPALPVHRAERLPELTCQIRRVARYFAISSEKSICALKNKLGRGAETSTSSSRTTACST
jgi:hypothetical protein